jgi:formylglycine-generating enzyme required for sulfatase activity
VRGMAGNMMDWTASVWSEDWSGIAVENDVFLAEPSGLPSEISTGSYRVNRGGCWYVNAKFSRVSNRYDSIPAVTGNNLGFRLAFTL